METKGYTLDDVEPTEVAAAVTALVDDGRRVIVTAEDTAALSAVRSVLPAAVTDRIVGALPTLAPADLHRLRGLLATSTPARRARATRAPSQARSAPSSAAAYTPAPPATTSVSTASSGPGSGAAASPSPAEATTGSPRAATTRGA